MIKLSAFLMSTYFVATSSVSAEEAMHHNEVIHDLAEGANTAEMAHAVANATDHHASKGGLPQFDPEWFASQIFWIGVSFAVLYIIFAKKTLPTISAVIENRKNHIQSNLESAEKITAEADTVHDAYNEEFQQAQIKAGDAIQKAETEIKDKSAAALDDFRARSDKEVKAAEGRINNAKMMAMDDMNVIAAEAASVAVEKIIGKTNASKVKAIVEGINGKARAA
jgi:F-type H+-transporting ATPase subunit b